MDFLFGLLFPHCNVFLHDAQTTALPRCDTTQSAPLPLFQLPFPHVRNAYIHTHILVVVSSPFHRSVVCCDTMVVLTRWRCCTPKSGQSARPLSMIVGLFHVVNVSLKVLHVIVYNSTWSWQDIRFSLRLVLPNQNQIPSVIFIGAHLYPCQSTRVVVQLFFRGLNVM